MRLTDQTSDYTTDGSGHEHDRRTPRELVALVKKTIVR